MPDETPVPSPQESAFTMEELSGGLSALIEGESATPSSSVRPRKEAEGQRLERTTVKEKWTNYEGGLDLVYLELTPRQDLPSSTPERFSAFSVAILVHLVLFVVIGLVVISPPRPEPPQLVVAVEHDHPADIPSPRLPRPNPEIFQPASASAQALDVISSVSASSFEVPDVANADLMVATAMDIGDLPVGGVDEPVHQQC